MEVFDKNRKKAENYLIPIDIVGYKSYNPIMFVGIIGITGESPDLSGDNIYFSEA